MFEENIEYSKRCDLKYKPCLAMPIPERAILALI